MTRTTSAKSAQDRAHEKFSNYIRGVDNYLAGRQGQGHALPGTPTSGPMATATTSFRTAACSIPTSNSAGPGSRQRPTVESPRIKIIRTEASQMPLHLPAIQSPRGLIMRTMLPISPVLLLHAGNRAGRRPGPSPGWAGRTVSCSKATRRVKIGVSDAEGQSNLSPSSKASPPTSSSRKRTGFRRSPRTKPTAGFPRPMQWFWRRRSCLLHHPGKIQPKGRSGLRLSGRSRHAVWRSQFLLKVRIQ